MNITPGVGTCHEAIYHYRVKPTGGTGSFTTNSKSVFSSGDRPHDLVLADMNGDHRLDVVVAFNAADNIQVLLNKKNGSTSGGYTYPVGDAPKGITTGDFNNDGNMDIAVSNSHDNNISVLTGNGDGTLNTDVTYSVGDNPHGITSDDFDGDGDVDLAVTNYNSATISVLLNKGNGTFSNAVSYSVGNKPRGITTGDFNGDGHLDLAVTNHGSGTVSILLGKENGTFNSVTTYNLPGNYSKPNGIVAGNFDGKNGLDLAIADNGSGQPGVSILLNKGDGTFGTGQSFQIGNYPNPQEIVTGDFDSDQTLDLAVTDKSGNTRHVAILLGGGNGTFSLNKSYTVDTDNVYGISAGDMDGNGSIDLVMVGQTSDKIAYLING